MCLACGATYHVSRLNGETKCAACGEELIQRKDDSAETVLNRLNVYHEQTAPLVEKVKHELPELPDALHARLQSAYGLPVADANTLVGDFKLCRYFEEAAAGSKHPRKVANWVINNLTAVLTCTGANV